MTNPIVKIINIETGEEVEREMNASEFKQFQVDEAKETSRLQDEATKAAERQAILDRLGLTAEEAQLLLGGN